MKFYATVENRKLPMAAELTEPVPYLAPQVETVLTSDQVEREVLYAGSITPPPWSNIPD